MIRVSCLPADNVPRAATIRCSSSGARVWVLERNVLRTLTKIVGEGAHMGTPTSHLIRTVEALAGLSEAQREDIASISEILTLNPGEFVCKAGDIQDAFFAIMHGQVKSTTKDGTLRHQYHRGDLIGAEALSIGAGGARHEETIVAVGTLRLLR